MQLGMRCSVFRVQRHAKTSCDGSGANDVGVGELVVPGLALGVPQHPEESDEAGDRRQEPGEVAADAAGVANLLSGADIDHPDDHRLLPERLRLRVVERAEVPDTDSELDQQDDRRGVAAREPLGDREPRGDEQCIPDGGAKTLPEPRLRARDRFDEGIGPGDVPLV